ncbi:MAG: helix-turn-helix domain-containing protein [Acidimicrobiia bacterium]|nr:helix-turn-helix domain-containing protein [Acidimicrobiia bacterium]
MTSRPSQSSTGIESLDDLLDGLIPGDNVVWVGDDDGLHDLIETAFLEAGESPRTVVILNDDAGLQIPSDVELIDARPGAIHADPMTLEEVIVERGRKPGARIVIRDLDTLVRRLGPDRALAFFARTCPRLFDLGAFAYWRSSRAGSGEILAPVQRVTQCVLEHNNNRLRVLKAESRPGIGGRILDIQRDDQTLALTEVRALGRLAEGIRRVRTERGLTQTDVASLAGVSPSAVSQVESGHRGLALDTLLTLSEALSVSLDELLDHRPDPGYILARRDRIPSRRGIVSLLDDPAAGLRAHLITLNPGERGGPPVIHKGAELVLIGHGLVQIELEQEAPVIRPGDALLVTRDAIKGWRNLHPESARLFWIVRD